MRLALRLARRAWRRGEIPVGAVFVDAAGRVLATACNEVEQQQDVTAHAEILGLRRLCAKLGNKYLAPSTGLFVTLEPCLMCMEALSRARLARLSWGSDDRAHGAISRGFLRQAGPRLELYPNVLQPACDQLLHHFFIDLRKKSLPKRIEPKK